MVFAANTLALLYFFANEAVVFKKVFAKKINKCSQRHEAKNTRQKKLPEAILT